MTAPDLLTRLEKATGPDRELDEALAEIAEWDPDEHHGEDLPHYTASIDAALTLVPEGWQWQISTRAPEPHAGRAYVHNGELQMTGAGMARNPAYRAAETTAPTPAIALCIAALRARIAEKES